MADEYPDLLASLPGRHVATMPVMGGGVMASVFLHGIVWRPKITADDVAVPLVGPDLEDALRAALSRRITGGSW